MNVLVCNAGSSSLKFGVFEGASETASAAGSIDWSVNPARLVIRIGAAPERREELIVRRHSDAMVKVLGDLRAEPGRDGRGLDHIDAVGHRVVHGGERFTSAVRITVEVERAIADLAELAPLHNPASLEVIAEAEKLLPKVPQVACFDTAFHSTLSPAARTYPLPRKWNSDWGLRRFGFHGLSYAYCSRRAAEMLGRDGLRLVIAHLGNGASMAAVQSGIAMDTSMGFTPLEGLMMGTRSGTVDPGLLLYVLRKKGLDAPTLDHALNFESGLLGVSGLSSDMRQVLAAAPANPDAALAVDIYVHRIRQTIGAMAATLGGVDALIFTAGVGENSAEIRSRTCDGLAHLGLALDPTANLKCNPDSDIARKDSPARILVISTHEDVAIVREVRSLLRPNISGQPA